MSGSERRASGALGYLHESLREVMFDDLRLVLSAHAQMSSANRLALFQEMLSLYATSGTLHSITGTSASLVPVARQISLIRDRLRHQLALDERQDRVAGRADHHAEVYGKADEASADPYPTPSVVQHIVEFFADKEPNVWYSLAEIASFESSQYAGNDRPSQGAVAARLYSANGSVVPGVAAANSKVSGKKGGHKVAPQPTFGAALRNAAKEGEDEVKPRNPEHEAIEYAILLANIRKQDAEHPLASEYQKKATLINKFIKMCRSNRVEALGELDTLLRGAHSTLALAKRRRSQNNTVGLEQKVNHAEALVLRLSNLRDSMSAIHANIRD